MIMNQNVNISAAKTTKNSWKWHHHVTFTKTLWSAHPEPTILGGWKVREGRVLFFLAIFMFSISQQVWLFLFFIFSPLTATFVWKKKFLFIFLEKVKYRPGAGQGTEERFYFFSKSQCLDFLSAGTKQSDLFCREVAFSGLDSSVNKKSHVPMNS